MINNMALDTMIWQTIQWNVAAMAKNKDIPESPESLKERIVKDVRTLIVCEEEDVIRVLNNCDPT